MAPSKIKNLKPKSLAKQSWAQVTGVSPERKTVPAQWVAGVFILLVGIFYSGLRLVESADEMRFLYRSMDELQTNQNILLANYSRLLLERSTLASMQTVEIVATNELQMFFPQNIIQVNN